MMRLIVGFCFLCLIAAIQAYANQQHSPFAVRSTTLSSTIASTIPNGGNQQAVSTVPVAAVALKAPPALYEGAVAAGTAKASASFGKIFQLGVVAGCHIAFGAYLAISVGGACPGIAADNPGLQKLIMGAIGLPTGLIMTLVTGAELFTGNTALVTSAYMEKKIKGKDLVKNWIASYLGNFVGSLLLAWLAYKSGTLGAAPGAVNLATAKASLPWDVAFYRGILCNWLVW
jgi:formate/nitrite transporter FocA (FNT family)